MNRSALMANKNSNTSTLHIVMAIDSLVGGGAEKIVLALAQQMIAAGHIVNIIIFNNEIEYDLNQLTQINITHVPFIRNHRGKIDYKQTAQSAENKIIELERNHKSVDMILSNLTHTDRVLTLLNRHNIFFVIHNHIPSKEKKYNRFFSRIKLKLKYQKIYNNRHIIGVSKGALEGLINGFSIKPKSQTIIYNGFNIEEIRHLATDDSEVDIDNFILHVGSFKKQKRHDRVIEAYEASGLKQPLVLIGGNGNLEQQVKALVLKKGLQDRVVFKSFTQNPYAWMRRASMTILGSDYEGFPLVLIESLIVGTPMVSVNCPAGPSEVLVNELAMCLCDMNAESLAKAMQTINENPPKIKEHHFINFSLEKIAAQYIELARLHHCE